MAALLAAMARAGTVNLNRLAPHIESDAKTASVHRRLERFFGEVRLDDAEVARVVVATLGLAGKPWHLAMDRSNWKFGKTEMNVLVLSVTVNRVCVPLFWSLLGKAGNSNTAERIHLMQRFIATFPDPKVASFAGDREFIGNRWFAWLQQYEIPHVLRLRQGMKVFDAVCESVSIAQHAARLQPGQNARADRCVAHRPVRGAGLAAGADRYHAAGQRRGAGAGQPPGPNRALALYRKRWNIESLFGVPKTRGFNLEATHMADPAKLSTLIALLTLAATFACKAGLALAHVSPIRRKTHGRPARSLLAHGLDAIRKIFAQTRFSDLLQIVLIGLTGSTSELRRVCVA